MIDHEPDDREREDAPEHWKEVEPNIHLHDEMGWYFSDECEQLNPEFHRGERGFDTIEECKEALKRHIENL